MLSDWTPERVLALAPDSASATAGRVLATEAKWVSLGHDDTAIWGEAKGSAALPYQTAIDLAEPAFKCSCPSRKFPCKHALGLFILATQAKVRTNERPTWVSEWIEKRAAKSSATQEPKTPKQEDPIAREKRAEQRRAKVEDGIAECETWLKDLVRGGLANIQRQGYGFWDKTAARMVDAQAPGLARQIRAMSAIPDSGEGWPERLLERLGAMYLLLQAYDRLPSLPEGLQGDVRSQIGFTLKKEDLPTEGAVRDCWCSVGQRVFEEERLRAQRIWVRGQRTGRFALLLSFATPGAPFDVAIPSGTAREGDIVFYPGNYPLRAHAGQMESCPFSTPPFDSISMMIRRMAEAKSANPWIETIPALVGPVRLVRGDRWSVSDGASQVPLSTGDEIIWRLLSQTGGHEFGLSGEWNGRRFSPLSLLGAGGLVAL